MELFAECKPRGVSISRAMALARIVCKEAHGPPPTPSHMVCHDTPNGCIGTQCLEPTHLRWGTRVDNEQDKPPELRKAMSVKAVTVFMRNKKSDLPDYVSYEKGAPKPYRVRIRSIGFNGCFNSVEEAVEARDGVIRR